MSGLLAAGISAAGGLLGGLFGSFSQSKSNATNLQIARETNQANRELAQYNWEQQVDMWNKQNAYNAPSAQMSRLRDAGLNPHLVYGNGVTGNNAGQTPTPQLAHMEAARVEPVNYGQGVSAGIEQGLAAYLNANRLKNETELAQSQVTAQSVENRLKLAQMMLEFSKTRGLEIDNIQKTKLFNYTLKGAEQDLIRQQNQNSLFDTIAARASLELEVSRNNLWMSKAQVAQVVKSTELIGANIARAYSDISLNSAKRREIDAIVSKLGLENRFASATFDDRVNMATESLSKLIATRKISEADLQRILHTGYATGEIGAIVNAIYAFGLNLGL